MRLIGDAVNLLISVQQSGWGTKENEKPHSTNDPTYEKRRFLHNMERKTSQNTKTKHPKWKLQDSPQPYKRRIHELDKEGLKKS